MSTEVDTDLDDEVTCIGEHSAGSAPTITGTEEMTADELADMAGWVETEDGWLCPAEAHARIIVPTYHVTNAAAGDDFEAICTTVLGAADAAGWLISEMEEQGQNELAIRVTRGTRPVAEIRAILAEEDEEE
jgi:hypothetical protein